MIFRLKPEKVQVREPDEKSPRRRWCFRLIYDADEHGLPSNAPEGAVYHGKRFEEAVQRCSKTFGPWGRRKTWRRYRTDNRTD